MTKYFPVFISFVFSMLLSGCVTPITLNEQVPSVSYVPKGKIAIKVNDQRPQVLEEGKAPTFIGKAHGVFGIPADWHVKPVLSTEKEDKDRTLAEFLEHRMVTGLGKSGWNVEIAEDSAPNMAGNATDRTLVMTLNDWFFSINLNWVTAFNFDSAVDVSVYSDSAEPIMTRTIEDRDVIDESASQSPQNLILDAYRAQLIQILMDSEVRQALTD